MDAWMPADGRRVLLKDDGTWRYLDPKAAKAEGAPEANVDPPTRIRWAELGRIAAEMTGTSTVLIMPTGERKTDPALIAMPHALPGLHLLLGAMVSSGGCLRWFRDQLPASGVRIDNLSESWLGFSLSGPVAVMPG